METETYPTPFTADVKALIEQAAQVNTSLAAKEALAAQTEGKAYSLKSGDPELPDPAREVQARLSDVSYKEAYDTLISATQAQSNVNQYVNVVTTQKTETVRPQLIQAAKEQYQSNLSNIRQKAIDIRRTDPNASAILSAVAQNASPGKNEIDLARNQVETEQLENAYSVLRGAVGGRTLGLGTIPLAIAEKKQLGETLS